MLYRIILTVGYRDAYIDFYNCEEAAEFATTIMEHYKQPEDEEKLIRVNIQVINPTISEKEDE